MRIVKFGYFLADTQDKDAEKTSMNTKIYGQLLSETIPGIIDSNEEYCRMEEIFAGLFKKKCSPEEDKLFELLANLMEDYEEKNLPELKKSTPLETLKFLINENDLKQTDLIDVFATQSIVSEILTGKRKINLSQAKKLADRFKVAVEIFI